MWTKRGLQAVTWCNQRSSAAGAAGGRTRAASGRTAWFHAPSLSPGEATRGREAVQADVAADWLSSAGQSAERQCEVSRRSRLL